MPPIRTPHLSRRLLAVVVFLAALALVPATALASPRFDSGRARAAALTVTASGFYIRGGGFGHGIGLSQYGALGYAEHGWSYPAILAHYYRGTSLGTVSPTQIVTVLLATGPATFSGADRAGKNKLQPGTSYSVHPNSAGGLDLYDGRHRVGSFPAPLSVSGPGPLTLAGVGTYHGSLVFRPGGQGQVETVNAVDLEDYVRGVVASEMPASWPAAALDAQAVAARTYVLTSGAVSSDYEVYSDTRSQVYGGVGAQTPSTDAAVAATRGQVVTYHGTPAVTYFFSSSGGYTESIQNVWLGSTPEPWLRGVPDPYDGAGGNPYHRWHVNLSLAAAAARLRGMVRGSLIGIRTLRHGVSPRIVTAAVVGTRGSTTVTGPELQQAFGLMSTLMSFTTVITRGSGRVLSGSVYPAGQGTMIAIQELKSRGWATVARVRANGAGAYRAAVHGSGRYRIAVGPVTGPAITLP